MQLEAIDASLDEHASKGGIVQEAQRNVLRPGTRLEFSARLK